MESPGGPPVAVWNSEFEFISNSEFEAISISDLKTFGRVAFDSRERGAGDGGNPASQEIGIDIIGLGLELGLGLAD